MKGCAKGCLITVIIVVVIGFIGFAYIMFDTSSSSSDIQSSQTSSLTDEQKKEIIITDILAKERAEIPMKIQQLSHVNNITIDSLVFTGNDITEAYIVSQWRYDDTNDTNGILSGKYRQLNKTVYVHVDNIRVTEPGKTTWNSSWSTAHIETLFH